MIPMRDQEAGTCLLPYFSSWIKIKGILCWGAMGNAAQGDQEGPYLLGDRDKGVFGGSGAGEDDAQPPSSSFGTFTLRLGLQVKDLRVRQEAPHPKIVVSFGMVLSFGFFKNLQWGTWGARLG